MDTTNSGREGVNAKNPPRLFNKSYDWGTSLTSELLQDHQRRQHQAADVGLAAAQPDEGYGRLSTVPPFTPNTLPQVQLRKRRPLAATGPVATPPLCSARSWTHLLAFSTFTAEASDSQAAGVASSVGSSSIVVWSFLEAADKLASAFPSYDNLSLNFAEPLPLAAAGGGGGATAATIVAEGPAGIGDGNRDGTYRSLEVGSGAVGTWEAAAFNVNNNEPRNQRRQRKLQPPLQQLQLQLQGGNSSAEQHTALAAAAAAATAVGSCRCGPRIPFTSSPDADGDGDADADADGDGDGEDEEMFTVVDALKALEDEAAITAPNGPSRGANPEVCSAGVGACDGVLKGRRRRWRRWRTIPSNAAADAAAAVPYQVGAESSLTQTVTMEPPAQRQPRRGVTAAEADADAALEPCVVPVGSCSPAVAVAAAVAAMAAADGHPRGSSCSAPFQGSLRAHRHVEEAAGGFRSGSRSGESDPDRDGSHRCYHHYSSCNVAMAVERRRPVADEADDGFGALPGSRSLVPERGGSGVPSTPGQADGCCYCLPGSKVGIGSGRGSGRDPPLSAGDWFAGRGGAGPVESMDLANVDEGVAGGLTMTADASAGDSGPGRVSAGEPREGTHGGGGGGGGGGGADGGGFVLVEEWCSTCPLGNAGLRTAVWARLRGTNYRNQPKATDTVAAAATMVTAAAATPMAETAGMADVIIRKKNSRGDDGTDGGTTRGGRGSGDGVSRDGGNGDGSHSRHADGSGCTAHAVIPVRTQTTGDSGGNAVHATHGSSGAQEGKAAAGTAAATAATPAAAAAKGGGGAAKQLASVGASGGGGVAASAGARRAQRTEFSAGVTAIGDARACGDGAMIPAGAGPSATATAAAAAVGGGAATASAGWHGRCADYGGGGGGGTAGVMHLPTPVAASGACVARTPPLLSRLSQLVSLTLAAGLGFPNPQHLDAITSLRSLQCLDMRGAKFMQVDGDASLVARQAWSHISNEHVAVVARCTSLTSLSLNHLHPVSGNQLAALTALNRLTYLALTDALSGNTVHGAHIKVLAEGLPELRSLDISRVTCPPLHLPPQQQQPQQPSTVQGLVAAAAAAAAAAGGGLSSVGRGGAAVVRQVQPVLTSPAPPPPPALPPQQQQEKQPLPSAGYGVAIKARSSSPSAVANLPYWQPWGPVLGLFRRLTSLHLQRLSTRCRGIPPSISRSLHQHLELIGRLGQLRCIRMDQVDIRTRDPDGWTGLSGVHTLESFSYRAWNNPVLSAANLCVLTNDSLAMMAANWPQLQHLSYHGKVALTEKVEEHLAHMSCLTSLEISGTDGTAVRVWRSAATGQLLRTVTLPYTAAAKVSSRNGYVTYSDSDDSGAKSEGSEASVNWMGDTGYVTSEYDAD
ncbi:hypothetical protein VOLCADRAFT_95758 [Volvox carteri f. nagariensis]|uniref:F-box domain-containing protein n=1 Tax=Volvox carteri f. nagariensis TaxID=3068 RepID=D8U8B1_VOLCA|nr:uncharacterized protein VOLCADRAFT_95758 [Volvox carteri f. nagariensis]EFJ44109.1 hypothetical protein VOLCADRAFT_95758 [Volvox carteri f. nagariensis]|eukprot:XP_002954910.1 hypothetical protein VOLCADRAFT_95758 [Volvox carteri f. nagariensis]